MQPALAIVSPGLCLSIWLLTEDLVRGRRRLHERDGWELGDGFVCLSLLLMDQRRASDVTQDYSVFFF